MLAGRTEVVGSDWRMAKFFILIMGLVTLMPLGMLNFSLAVLTSILLTYPAVLATPYLPKSVQC